MSAPGYQSYRESVVDWNARVPAHWTDTRLRFVAVFNPSKSEAVARDRHEEVSFIPMDAVGDNGTIRLDQTREVGDVETGYTYFADGDVTFAKITPCFENGKGAVMRGLKGGIGFGTTELIVARPTAGNSAEFLHWLFTSPPFRKLGEGSMYGAGGQKRVPDDFVRDFRLALPSVAEQAAIAAFLDRETGKIDALVEAQRRLIELLKEKRQAVISHAVTTGLDRTAPMKDSGVEWLGKVPAHWEVSRVKYAASHVVDCLHTTPTYEGELLFPAIRTADVQRGRLLLGGARLVSREIYEERIQRLRPEADDIVYTREGERFGLAALIPPGVDLCLGQRMMMVRIARDYVPAFVMWVLNSDPVYQQVVSGITGATAPHVNISEVINFHLPVPPICEQRVIAEHILADTAALDRLAEEAEAATLLLQERRAALISAAVTGKIDVRGLVTEQAEAA